MQSITASEFLGKKLQLHRRTLPDNAGPKKEKKGGEVGRGGVGEKNGEELR